VTPENMEKILILYCASKNQWLYEKTLNKGPLQNYYFYVMLHILTNPHILLHISGLHNCVHNMQNTT
jgi:hypothetical protein